MRAIMIIILNRDNEIRLYGTDLLYNPAVFRGSAATELTNPELGRIFLPLPSLSRARKYNL